MINVYEKYKKDFWALGGLIFIFILYCIFIWGRAGDIIIDCPREIWLPEELLKGKALYTEIFSLYPPLGYYLNALFVKVFGHSFHLFYLLGMLNTGIILGLVYFISRTFAKQLLSFSITLLVICYCLNAYSSVVNYLLPYSYSFVYSLTCFLFSILLLILYFKRSFKSAYILSSLLFAGFSVAFKLEFFLSFLPLLIVLFKYEKSIRTKAAGVVLFFLPPILPFIYNTEGIKIFIHNFIAFCNSPSSKVFIKTVNIKTPQDYLFSTIKDISVFLLYFVPFLFLFKKSENYSKLIKLGILAFYLVFISLSYKQILFHIGTYVFSWLTIPAFIFFIKYLRNEKTDNNFLNLTLSLILILSSLRVGGYVSVNHYGKYFLPLFFIVFFCIYLPEILKKIEDNYEKYISLFLIIFSFFSICFFGQRLLEGKNYKIKTDKGTVYSLKPVGKTVEETAEYIKQNSSPNDSVLVLPEGLIINLLAGRKSHDMFYQLLPNHIEILGENNIIKKLAETPPEYIVLSSLATPSYGKRFFCIDYGLEICDFINSNYIYLETFSNQEEQRQFMMMVLKLKKDI